jgi:hypothetical protein
MAPKVGGNLANKRSKEASKQKLAAIAAEHKVDCADKHLNGRFWQSQIRSRYRVIMGLGSRIFAVLWDESTKNAIIYTSRSPISGAVFRTSKP